MKLKLIALAAAGMLAAGSANALIVDGASGNGEMFMTVFDSVNLKSYTLDLNLTMDDFLSGIAGSGASYNWAADANMSSFLVGTSAADLTFAIGAMDNTGANATNYYRYITSSNDIVVGTSTSSQVRNVDLKQLGTSGDTFVANTNTLIGAGNSLIVTDPATGARADDASWGANWGSKANFTTTALIGDDLGMYFLRQTSGATAANNTRSSYASVLQGGNQVFANLDMSGNLVIAAAPVPEAETYAMMLAGLGLVGFMAARRRNLV